MRSVSRFEADLLRILHALLGRSPIEGAWPLIAARRERPTCLSRGAVELVQDTLAKGCVWRLASQGGWLADRYLRGDRVVSGRLWERTAPEELGLHFSRDTLGFLIWLTADHPADRPVRWNAGERDLTIGDRLLLFYAYEAMRNSPAEEAKVRELPQFARNALARLAFPDDFLGLPELDFSPWMTGPDACILEAFQPYLAARWVALDRQKFAIPEPRRMIVLGHAQESTLTAFLDAIDRADRPDLARFLLAAVSTLLREVRDPRAWISALEFEGLRLADRAEAYRAALTLLRAFGRLQEWERRARGVGYFDEGYAASQLWKTLWEAHDGERLCGQSDQIVRAVDPLGPGSLSGAAREA